MSFIYPRTIAITRPIAQTGVGAQSYSGELASAESSIASGISASIQMRRKGVSGRNQNLPADAPATDWAIFIPLSQGSLGEIAERDIVTDDLGRRYQVDGAYWDSLGYQLLTTLLQV